MNTKVITDLTIRPDMHTLTRESQEVVVGVILVTKALLFDIEVALKSWISLTDIPHSGQLNLNSLHSSIVWCISEVKGDVSSVSCCI